MSRKNLTEPGISVGRTSFLHLSARPSTARSVRFTQSDKFSDCREVSLHITVRSGQVRSGQIRSGHARV